MTTKTEIVTKEHIIVFNEIVSRMSVPKITESQKSIVFMIGDDIYMELILRNNVFYIRYKDFWEIFESKFKLNYQEISNILSQLLSQYMHLNITKTNLEYIEF